MSKFKFKLRGEGVKELLKGEAMQGILDQQATDIRNRCGPGYEQDVRIGRKRANAMVWAETFKAKNSNKKNNTLLKAFR